MAVRSRLVARIAAAGVLIGLAFGVPVALSQLGSPLPAHWPSLTNAARDLRIGYVPADVVARAGLLAGWAAWAFVTYEVLAESVSWAQHQVSRHAAALGPIQPLVSKLVATAVLSVPVAGPRSPVPTIALTQAAATRLATPRPPPPQQHIPAPASAPESIPLTTQSEPVAAAHTEYVVEPRDSLWRIASRRLGDPLAWRSIWELNQGREMAPGRTFDDPSLIDPGWVLLLPTAPAAGPSVPPPSAPPNGTPTSVGSAAQPPPRTPVEPGDNGGVVQPDHRTESGPARVSPANSPDNGEGRVPVLPIGAGLLGLGVLGLVARQRRAQQRHRRSGRRIPIPTGGLARVEAALSAPGDPDAARWLAGTLNLIGTRLAEAGVDAEPLAMSVNPGGIEVRFTSDPGDPSEPFGPAGPCRWVLSRTPEAESALMCDAGVAPSPFPAMVTLGEDAAGRLVLVNLESLGSVSVMGSRGTEVAAAMAVELATSAWRDQLEVHSLGLPADLPGVDDIRRLASPEDATSAITSRAAVVEQLILRTGMPSAVTARVTGADTTWPTPMVVCLVSAERPELSLPGADQLSRFGIAVVAVGELPGAGLVLDASGEGLVDVPLLDTRLKLQRLSRPQLAGIDSLLRMAARRDDVAVDEPPYDRLRLPLQVDRTPSPEQLDAPPTCEQVQEGPSSPSTDIGEPNGNTTGGAEDLAGSEVYVQLIAPFRIIGGTPPGKRTKVEELIGWLVSHRSDPDLDEMIAAVWPKSRPESAYVNNLLWKVRKALGNGPDGKPHLPADRKGLTLGPYVTTDRDRFRTLAESDDPEACSEALALVRGVPFGGRDWAWTTGEGITSDIESEVVDVAEKVAEFALAGGNPAKAAWAAEQGLLTSPADERLFRVLMRAADASGNPAGVRAAMDRLLAVLEETVASSDSVHPDTWELYMKLMHRSPGPRVVDLRQESHRSEQSL